MTKVTKIIYGYVNMHICKYSLVRRSTQIYDNYGHLLYKIQLNVIYHPSTKRRRGNEIPENFIAFLNVSFLKCSNMISLNCPWHSSA